MGVYVLTVKNDSVLIEIESMLQRATQDKPASRPTAHDFAGLWSKEEAEGIEKAIEEDASKSIPVSGRKFALDTNIVSALSFADSFKIEKS